MTHAQKIVVIAVAVIIGGLGVRLLTSHSGAANTVGAEKVDLSAVYTLIDSQEFRQSIRDAPECADERAAAQFYETCFELFQSGPDADCARLDDRPTDVTIPKDFEQAYHLKTLNYRDAPKDCQSHRFGITGHGYLSGRNETNDQ